MLAMLEDGPKRTHELAAFFTWGACRNLAQLAADGIVESLSPPLTAWRDRLWAIPGTQPTLARMRPVSSQTQSRSAKRPPRTSGFAISHETKKPADAPVSPLPDQTSGASRQSDRPPLVEQAVRAIRDDEIEFDVVWNGGPLIQWPDHGLPQGSSLSTGTYRVSQGKNR